MEHGLKYFTFYVNKYIAPLAIMFYNLPLVRDKPLGAPAFVKLVYWVLTKEIFRKSMMPQCKLKSFFLDYFQINCFHISCTNKIDFVHLFNNAAVYTPHVCTNPQIRLPIFRLYFDFLWLHSCHSRQIPAHHYMQNLSKMPDRLALYWLHVAIQIIYIVSTFKRRHGGRIIALWFVPGIARRFSQKFLPT